MFKTGHGGTGVLKGGAEGFGGQLVLHRESPSN